LKFHNKKVQEAYDQNKPIFDSYQKHVNTICEDIIKVEGLLWRAPLRKLVEVNTDYFFDEENLCEAYITIYWTPHPKWRFTYMKRKKQTAELIRNGLVREGNLSDRLIIASYLDHFLNAVGNVLKNKT
jgi:hypothetical protein